MHLSRLVLTCLALTTTLAATTGQVSRAPAVFTVDPVRPACPAGDQPCSDWLRFRRLPAGPYQGFAVAARAGRATVVIAEPPAPRDQLLALVDATFGEDLVARSYKRWPTGLDGWVEDLVLDVQLRGSGSVSVVSGHDLAPWSAPAEVVDRLLFLYGALHATTDGFSVENISAFPVRPSTPAVAEPDAPAADLFDWLNDASQTWKDVTGATPAGPFKSLQLARSPSVHVRSDGSLVAFAVPAKSTLAALAVPFRRFAVASDLLLGAYRVKNGATFLIGRARQEPFTTLPPLRFETFSSFVRYRTTELMQSYERQRIFAGRVRSGPFRDWDWAPILLSSQLDDSEFGTLLNQADQILKSWSQAGEVEYYAFNHHKPVEFPFGDRSASEFFAGKLGTTSLVFNWNTESFSTIFQVDPGELLSIDRYGALPILYIPAGNVFDGAGSDPGLNNLRREVAQLQTEASKTLSLEAAITARKYFAQRGDPILVRVVQNALLYQIAQAFLGGVHAPSSPPEPARWETVSRILREEATTWLRSVAAPGPMAGMNARTEARLEAVIRSSGLSVEQLAETIATPQVTSARLASAMARYRRDLDRYNNDVRARLKLEQEDYRRAFEAFCAAAGGTIKERPASLIGSEKGGRTCEYNETGSVLAGAALKRVKAAEARLTALGAEADALEKSVEEKGAEMVALFEAYRKADSLAQTLASEAGFTAQLDRILARVRQGLATEPRGSIRTPALVLSRNTEDEESIGGHNITFDPARIRITPPAMPATTIRPARTAGARPALAATIRKAGAAPAADAPAALKTARRGSLLDEMRAASGREIDAAVSGRLKQQAATCECDALVVRTADGEILFVRTQPPPVERQLLGTTEIAPALAGPPKANVVRFDGFADSPGFVESIVQSTQLARNAAAESTPLGRLTDFAARMFRRGGASTGTEATLFAYTRRTGVTETVRVVGPEGTAGQILRKVVGWRGATVAPGKVRTLESGGHATSALVRFAPSRGQATIEAVRTVGVEVEMAAGRQAVTPQRLQSVLTASLLEAPLRPSEVAEGILMLRQSIQRQMSPAEITFLLEGGSTPVRVSELPPGGPKVPAR